ESKDSDHKRKIKPKTARATKVLSNQLFKASIYESVRQAFASLTPTLRYSSAEVPANPRGESAKRGCG
ncbi:MAG: hypothetical protein MUP16_10425, partial [Sedimentisphaerales bacterium]|nr:hypothetical protein [Sedimentisphaerales bacterium]